MSIRTETMIMGNALRGTNKLVNASTDKINKIRKYVIVTLNRLLRDGDGQI